MRNILLAPLVASLLLSCASADVRERKVSSAQTAATPISDIFSEFTPPRPVPEIMSLKPGEVVPIGTYAKYSSKHIGLTIVYKKFVEEERASGAEVAKPFYDYFNGGEIQLAFSEKNIESIAAKGFLNTHQVGKSMELYRRGRVRLEDGFLGYV